MDSRAHSHIPALDGVRGLAILLVTLYRFGAGPEDSSLLGHLTDPAFNFGMRGVDLFFVLSGFLITGILYDAKDERNYFRDFYARRLLRIFPLYYGVLFIAFCVVPAIGQIPPTFAAAHEHQVWLWAYGANLLIAWRGQWCLGSFDHLWSLAVEEHFYLLWPLVVYGCSRRNAIRIAVTLAVGSAIARIAWCACGGDGPAAEVFTLFRLDSLLVGAWLALVARGPNGLRTLLPFAKRVAWVSGLLLLPAIVLQRRFLAIPEALYAVFFGALIMLAITARPTSWAGRLWNWHVLRVLGKYSYGMYVFQKPLIALLAVLFTAEGLAHAIGSPLWGRLCYIALMSGATFLVAFASWHLYEKHFLKLKRYFSGERSVSLGVRPATMALNDDG